MRADKDEIRARNDIVDVVGTVVTLRKRGRNWVGLCPFHQEKTPSFNVDPVTQSFKCFGCGVSGDVFSFIERYENMTFIEAAGFLARRVGLSFEPEGRSGSSVPTSERDRIYAANVAAMEWFVSMLPRTPEAKAYVDRRGIGHDAQEQFKIGFAPDRWDGLAGFLEVRHHDLAVAEKAGLVRKSSTGQYTDVFRNRLMFPIHDDQQRVVGFGGRALGDDEPKYLNTGETPVFVKSRLLYGLPFARRKVASDGRVLLMEGYIDVVSAHQAGFCNAVATLGTSLTEEHAHKLARLMPTDPVVVLVYDGDNAGIKATMRASEILEQEGVQVRVVTLPPEDDPDSLLRRGETATFQRAIDGALGRVEYQLDRVVSGADTETLDGRRRLLRKIVAILASVPSRAERDLYMERVWRYHHMSASGPTVAKEQLHRDVEAWAARHPRSTGRSANSTEVEAPPPPLEPAPTYQGRREKWSQRPRDGWRKDRPQAPQQPPPVAKGGLTADERAERELVRALFDPAWRGQVIKRADPDDLEWETGARLLELAREHQSSLGEDETVLVDLLVRDKDERFSEEVRRELQEFRATTVNVPLSQEAIIECLGRLRKRRVRKLKDELSHFLQSKPVLTDEDTERVRQYQQLLNQLQSPTGSGPEQGGS